MLTKHREKIKNQIKITEREEMHRGVVYHAELLVQASTEGRLKGNPRPAIELMREHIARYVLGDLDREIFEALFKAKGSRNVGIDPDFKEFIEAVERIVK